MTLLRTHVPLIISLVLLFLLSPLTPSTSDGVNFLLSINKYSLEIFQPHFPGYPLYVALTKALHACGLSAPLALVTVNLMGLSLVCLSLEKLIALTSFQSCLVPLPRLHTSIAITRRGSHASPFLVGIPAHHTLPPQASLASGLLYFSATLPTAAIPVH